jgi:hypothetical protein
MILHIILKLWYHKNYDIIHNIIYYISYHVWYHVQNHMILYMISYMMVFLAFLARMILYEKLWYHIWYHSSCSDITYDITKSIIKSLSCAIFMVFCIWYHIHFLWFCPWCHYYVKSYLKLPMIYAIDIIITCYHGHTISHILWYLSPYHGTCAAGWRWLGAPGARCSTGSSHAIANMLGTCVQLNSDCLDAVHGLVALAAARVMHCCRFVVIKKSRLAAAAAAGCAAHAGIAPMHSLSSRLGWHWGFKYGFGVQDGFKLETGEEGEAGRECQ